MIIDVENGSDEPFSISSMEVACSCIDARMKSEALKPGAVSPLRVVVDVPKDGSSVMQTQWIRIKHNAEKVMQIDLKYSIGGMCCFAKNRVSVSSPAGKSKIAFSVPVLVTDPVDPKDIKFRGIGDLENCQFKLVLEEDASELRCTIDVPREGKFLKSGSILLENQKRKTESVTDCYVFRDGDLVITPAFLSFKKSGDNREASAIVRLSKGVLDKAGDKPLEMVVAASANPLKLTIDRKDMGAGLCKIKLVVSEADLERLDSEINRVLPSRVHFQVSWIDGIGELDVPLSFGKR